MLLGLSIVTLFAGVGVSSRLLRRDNLASFLEGMVTCFVGCVVFLELIPHCVEAIGFWALLAVVAGLALIFLSEVVSHGASSLFGTLALLLGFGIHGVVDGAALALSSLAPDMPSMLLAWAVIVHRFPVGIVLGTFGKGFRQTMLLAVAISVATVIGYSGMAFSENGWLMYLQAAAAGALIHVVLGHPITKKSKISFRLPGALLAGLLYFSLGDSHGHGHDDGFMMVWRVCSMGLIAFLAFRPLSILCLAPADEE